MIPFPRIRIAQIHCEAPTEVDNISDAALEENRKKRRRSGVKCPHPECGKTLRNFKGLGRHCIVNHDGKKLFPCPRCDKRLMVGVFR